MKKIILFLFSLFFLNTFSNAESGYRLWLRYDLISNQKILENYRSNIAGILCEYDSPTLNVASKELQTGLEKLLDVIILNSSSVDQNGTIILGTNEKSDIVSSIITQSEFDKINDEGFIIKSTMYNRKDIIIIAGKKDVGVLYGVFNFLRLLQTQQSIENLSLVSSPKIKLRLLDHWDNLDRTIERGYAGFSIWDWHKLPGYIDQRYIDYARANASIGINGSVVTSVNANALILTQEYLLKVKALADAASEAGLAF